MKSGISHAPVKIEKVDIDLNKTVADLKNELQKKYQLQHNYMDGKIDIPAELYRVKYFKKGDKMKMHELILDNKKLKDLDIDTTKRITVRPYKVSYYCQFTQKSPNLVVPGPKNAEK